METICRVITPYGVVAVEFKVLLRYHDPGKETVHVWACVEWPQQLLLVS
jgi:hypothetical protein